MDLSLRDMKIGIPTEPKEQALRPADLELRQKDAETFDVLWKVPALGEDLRFGLCVELPPADWTERRSPSPVWQRPGPTCWRASSASTARRR
jgi:hypothetical protein